MSSSSFSYGRPDRPAIPFQPVSPVPGPAFELLDLEIEPSTVPGIELIEDRTFGIVTLSIPRSTITSKTYYTTGAGDEP